VTTLAPAAPRVSSAKAKNPPVRGWFWRHRRLWFVAVIVSVTTIAGMFYVFEHIPLPPEVIPAETTFLYDASGKKLATLNGGENRVYVKLNHIPKIMQEAAIAREDKTFYSHSGVDPMSIVRASWKDLLAGRTVQGGSTITQQYVKQTYVGTRRNLTRKIREAAIAMRLEEKLSKDQILERYLNTVYFGRGAYGVSAASQAYYNKDISDVTINQAAFLASLISEPNRGDVYANADRATKQRNDTLKAMKGQHYITKEQYESAVNVPVKSFVINAKDRQPSVAIPNKGTQYFVEEVRQELVKKYGQDVVLRGGLRVTTTLNEDLQSQAYDSVYGFLKPGEPAGALVSINDKGEVVAMVGGRDWQKSKVNYAVGTEGGGSGRQPGSTFKAFLLAEFLREGYNPRSTLYGPAQYVIPHGNGRKDYIVNNAEPVAAGDLSVVDATAHSVNTIFAQIEQQIGPQKLVDEAKRLGIKSPLAPNYSLVLGSAEVSPLEMAGAYSTFADRGVHIEPHFIKSVRTADGKLLDRTDTGGRRVMSQKDADTVNYILQQVIKRGTGTGANYGGVEAGKTGTTTDFGDAWFIGYNPKLTTAVWMGYPEGLKHKMNNVRGRRVFGGTFPATMWRLFMSQAIKHQVIPPFAPPPSFTGRLMKSSAALLATTSTSVDPNASSTTVVGENSTSTTDKNGEPSTTILGPPLTK
jgi:penicillin-binding protein 1A